MTESTSSKQGQASGMRHRTKAQLLSLDDAQALPLVNWNAVERLAFEIADSVDAEHPAAFQTVQALLMRLLSPHLALEELHGLARRASRRDRYAQTLFGARLREAVERLSELAELGDELIHEAARPNCCGDDSSTVNENSQANIVQFDALAELMIAAARTCDCDTESEGLPGVALVVGLAAQTAPLEALREAHTRGGSAALVGELNWLASTGSATMLAPFVTTPMRTMSGSLPGLPGLPGGLGGLGGQLPPGLGGSRGGEPGLPPGPNLPGSIADWLRKKILDKWRPKWDPEIWDHKPIYKGPWQDPRTLRCAIALGKLAAARAGRPPTPAKAVWSDNITSISAPNPCAGAMLRINGHGFGDPKPANVGLMLPLDGRCTPTQFVPGTWHDDSVEMTMPANITSGPIGFVDLDYVNAYNAWADGLNNALLTLVLEGCGGGYKSQLADHFHECPPTSAVNGLAAGAAFIHAFTVNGEGDLVLEPGDMFTLAWDVVNSTNVVVERTSGSGPLIAGSTYAGGLPEVGSLALTANHNGPETWSYRLTAQGRCGNAVAQITIVATKQPRLVIDTIEVTQGLQTIPPTMRFVAGKDTVVRVTVRHGLNGWGSNSVPNVTGRIQVRYGNAASVWLDPANNSPAPMRPIPGANITVPSNPLRQNVNDTLNFFVPGALCTGNPTFRVEARVAAFDARAGSFAGFSESVQKSSASVLFETRRIVELRYVPLNWGAPNAPNGAQCDAALRNALPMLPTPSANIFPAPVGVRSPTPTLQAALDDLYDLHNCSAWEALTEWLGSDCPDEDDTKWVGFNFAAGGGIAYRPSDNPPGNVCIIGDTFTSTVAHELSHTFDQQHLTSVCAGGGAPANAENASGFPGGGQLTNTPFDTVQNAALQSGTGLWDVMTYCQKIDRWPTAERWRRLWDQIG
jgi:hypothetical protein